MPSKRFALPVSGIRTSTSKHLFHTRSNIVLTELLRGTVCGTDRPAENDRTYCVAGGAVAKFA